MSTPLVCEWGPPATLLLGREPPDSCCGVVPAKNYDRKTSLCRSMLNGCCQLTVCNPPLHTPGKHYQTGYKTWLLTCVVPPELHPHGPSAISCSGIAR